MILNIKVPATKRDRIRTLGKAQERAVRILAQTPTMRPPRRGQVSARGLVRRHTFESLAGGGLARMKRLDDGRLLFVLTAPGKQLAHALGIAVKG